MSQAPNRKPNSNYAPRIESATPKQRFEIGDHKAVLLDDIVPAGAVQYRFILVVYDPNEEACYFVASEENQMAERLGGGSHFLCLFDENGHSNCGHSDNWADEEKFTSEALRIVREKFTSGS